MSTPRVQRSPFAEAMRVAIERQGFTLSELSDALRARGLHTSSATVSHWQTDRTQPLLRASREAITALEAILDLPHRSLSGLVGVARPRGRRVNARSASRAKGLSPVSHSRLAQTQVRHCDLDPEANAASRIETVLVTASHDTSWRCAATNFVPGSAWYYRRDLVNGTIHSGRPLTTNPRGFVHVHERDAEPGIHTITCTR